MKLIGLCRLGRDAEVRYTASGDPVLSFSAAFNYGRKGEGEKQPSQWVEFSLWGKRAESLEPWLKKGTQVFIVAGEPHVETFERREGGQGVKLAARVDDLQFAGPRPDAENNREAAAPAAAPAPAPRAAAPKAAPKSGTGFDDLDDDIPF